MSRSPLKAEFDRANPPVPSKPGKPFMPFWLPGQAVDTDLPEHVRPMDRKALVNILNYLHFSDRSLFAHVQENGNHDGYLLPVYPEPCLDGEIACRWPEPTSLDDVDEMVRNLVIDDGKAMIVVPVMATKRNEKTFASRLPDKSYVISRRQEKRYPCSEITVEILTKGQTLRGGLRDFSSSAFGVDLDGDYIFNKPLLKTQNSVKVELRRGETLCFSGTCACLRFKKNAGNWEAVLLPDVESVQVFKKRTIRNPRVQLTPSPIVSFVHPLLQTRVQREVSDICSSGFSISEDRKTCLLFPGLLIPDLSFQYAGSSVVEHSSATVVYRNDESENAHCGIAILDVGIDGYTRLNQLVENALDPCAQTLGKIDPDALWEFFFSTGFIYPKKYRAIQIAKQEFKENCRKHYQGNSEIAQHFLYQNNGRIYGHLSISRAYERAWIIHHHAGRTLNRRKSGLMVLSQVMHYFNDYSRMPSHDIDYAMCFFRPENRFPALVFGGLTRKLKNKQICSMDLFTYLPLTKFSVAREFEDGWHVGEITRSDREVLERFYAEHSGGLLLEAMSIAGTEESNARLEAMYSQIDLMRKTKVYTLKRGNEVVAVFIADHSSRGLNFSELMNCIKVIVLREKELPWEVLHRAISQVSREYDMKKVPIMCYPSKYLEIEGIASDKSYQVWVFRLSCVDVFMEYMRQRFRLS